MRLPRRVGDRNRGTVVRYWLAQITLIRSEKLAPGSTHPRPPMTMFHSSGCISLLLYGLKTSLATAALPPISMSDVSLAAAPLPLPDNTTLSSDLNVTQQQQELLQTFNSNQTSATYVESPDASPQAV